MWRRSSISSASRACRALRYSALSLGRRTPLVRASSVAGFKGELFMTDLAFWRIWYNTIGEESTRQPATKLFRPAGATPCLAPRALEMTAPECLFSGPGGEIAWVRHSPCHHRPPCDNVL